MKQLISEIERVLPDGGTWCSFEKAQTLAAIIVGLRPRVVVEIGIWAGGSMVPMLLALKHNGSGRAIAIDPWSPSISVANEVPANVAWWKDADHEAALRTFLGRMETLNVARICDVWRRASDDCEPPAVIDLLHVDGSHTEQAVRDVKRYAANVNAGGILVLDDLEWQGDGVRRAHELALALGFIDLYSLGTGVVMQRANLVDGARL